jgi:2-iminobutanoate/2-iminopropanoate deaminase
MKKEVVFSKKAPGAVGPYSQGIKGNGFVFVSGQLPIDPATGAFPSDNVAEQAEQSIKNVMAVLAEAGSSIDQVVKSVVLLSDIGDFGTVNEVYAKYFKTDCPARSCFEVAKLPKAAKVEVEVIALA